ncbi:MAG: hypothetical protein KDB00_23195 [Planctomycetales bacterium]|nr:hypothetical protein [Planctomycetales bacterium]
MTDQRSPRIYWGVQVLLLSSIVAWAYLDPQFGLFADSLNLPLKILASQFGVSRLVAGAVVAVLAPATMLRLLVGMAGPSRTFRSLGALLVITTLVGLWCGLAVGHPTISWLGKRARMVGRVDQLESIARSLREDWPRQDGEIAELGPYMAYPFGQPSTLILLTPPQLTRDGTSVSAVERTDSGALLFQLSGIEGSDWAEWHPESSLPQSFKGGLGDLHQLSAKLPLGHGWYLVRYAGQLQREPSAG